MRYPSRRVLSRQHPADDGSSGGQSRRAGVPGALRPAAPSPRGIGRWTGTARQHLQRLGFVSISELPAARDAQLGELFLTIRVASGLDQRAMALRLGVSTATLADLESGAIRTMAGLDGIGHLVETYAALADRDPHPILQRVLAVTRPEPTPLQITEYAGRSALAGAVWPSVVPLDAIAAQPRDHVEFSQGDGQSRKAAPANRLQRRLRRLAVFAGAVAVVAVLVIFAAATAWTHRAVAVLPAPLDHWGRRVLEATLMATSQRRDGMAHIDLADPRARKADRLAIGTPRPGVR